jgi:hypothetical protein
VPERVNVEGSAPLVALGNAGGFQVAVENLAQLVGHVENGRIARQPGRNRGASAQGVGLEPDQLVGEPLAKIAGEVIADRHGVPVPVLLVCGVEREVGTGAVEGQLSHGKGSQLAPTKSGQE